MVKYHYSKTFYPKFSRVDISFGHILNSKFLQKEVKRLESIISDNFRLRYLESSIVIKIFLILF